MKKTLYPLTQTQNIIMYSLKYVPNRYANISVEFEFTCEIDKNILLQAVTLSIMRNPNNFTRLTKVGKEVKQYFTDEQLDKVEYKEYTDNNEYENSLIKYAQTPFPNKHLETQLLRIRVVKKPNGNIAINGCFSHLIYDAYSTMMALADICDVYKALLHETPIPKISYPLLEAFEIDYAYNNSNKFKNDEEYFDKTIYNTEPQFSCINGKDDSHFIKNQRKGKLAISLSMKGGSLDLPIDKALTERVSKYATNNKVTAQVIYLLASRSYLAKVCEVDDVTLGNTLDRRPTAIQKRAGGTMADATYIRTIFKDSISFKDALKIVFAAELDSYKHSSYGAENCTNMTHRKFNCPPTKTYSTFYLSYQPYTYADDTIKYKIRHISNGTEVINVYLSIGPCDSELNYICNYVYQSQFVSEKKLREFHNFMTNFVQIGIENENLPIKEITKKAMNNNG